MNTDLLKRMEYDALLSEQSTDEHEHVRANLMREAIAELRALNAEKEKFENAWHKASIRSGANALKAETAEGNQALLLKAVKELESDLFYQIDSKHGPKAASEYPSILAARSAVSTINTDNTDNLKYDTCFVEDILEHAFLSVVVAANEIPPGDDCIGKDLWERYEPYHDVDMSLPIPYKRKQR